MVQFGMFWLHLWGPIACVRLPIACRARPCVLFVYSGNFLVDHIFGWSYHLEKINNILLDIERKRVRLLQSQIVASELAVDAKDVAIAERDTRACTACHVCCAARIQRYRAHSVEPPAGVGAGCVNGLWRERLYL